METIDLKKAAEARKNEVLFLRRHIRKLEGEIDDLRTRLGGQTVFANAVAAAIVAADPLPRFHYKHSSKRVTVVEPVLKLSDWHIGEVVRSSETEGFGRYNWHVAQERVYGILNGFLKWVELKRTMYPISACSVFCEGDYVSGDIHHELQVTNEFPLPVQTEKAGRLMAEVYRILASHFERVKIYQIAADNHGRLTNKPHYKERAANNMSHLVFALSNAVADNLTNVRFISSEGAKILGDVNGWKFLVEHGDSMRGWMGMPYYGMERQLGKEARRRMRNNRGFDYWSLGHWHVPSKIGGMILVNGSLSGTSELDHINGRHAGPAQVAFVVHPEHGVFDWTEFNGRG